MKYAVLIWYFFILVTSIFMIVRYHQDSMKYFFIIAIVFSIWRMVQIGIGLYHKK